jgi:hypothetical protein
MYILFRDTDRFTSYICIATNILPPPSALKMEAVCSSETLVPIYKYRRRHSPEDSYGQLHCRVHSRSHIFVLNEHNALKMCVCVGGGVTASFSHSLPPLCMANVQLHAPDDLSQLKYIPVLINADPGGRTI